MTRVRVNAGACGFTVTIIVKKDKERNLRVALDTDCEMVRKMEVDISFLSFGSVFSSILNNPVYRAASRHLKHPACPVPTAVLKAVEVEAGVNLSRQVSITFEE